MAKNDAQDVDFVNFSGPTNATAQAMAHVRFPLEDAPSGGELLAVVEGQFQGHFSDRTTVPPLQAPQGIPYPLRRNPPPRGLGQLVQAIRDSWFLGQFKKTVDGCVQQCTAACHPNSWLGRGLVRWLRLTLSSSSMAFIKRPPLRCRLDRVRQRPPPHLGDGRHIRGNDRYAQAMASNNGMQIPQTRAERGGIQPPHGLGERFVVQPPAQCTWGDASVVSTSCIPPTSRHPPPPRHVPLCPVRLKQRSKPPMFFGGARNRRTRSTPNRRVPPVRIRFVSGANGVNARPRHWG